MADVTIRSAAKRYGAVEVLRDVSIDIADGAFVILVGPSGCGKSTLLRMIAGLEAISAGDILIGGQRVNDLAPKDRDIAMVFQNYALYPHMTIAENMGFSLRLAGVPKAEIMAKVGDAARILGLETMLDRRPGALSGGQRQRVAMGRAIVRKPQVFLFDEPLSNLDAKLRVQMRAEIKELHQRLETTTIYVTHDQVEAMTMADTIIVMKDGAVEQAGSPLDLYDQPINTFVAGFIGSPSMNFIPGASGVDGFLTTDGHLLPAPPVAGASRLYGIRPEHLHPSEDGIQAEVVVVEPMGSETQVLVRIGTQQVVCIMRERFSGRPGSTIRLRPDVSAVHLFDEHGLRLSESLQ